jgi:hypothetical protein
LAEPSLSDAVVGALLDAFRAHHPEARAFGDLRAGTPARVLRLDREGGYVLVPLYERDRLRGIVHLESDRQTIESSAVIRDPAAAFLLTGAEALRAAARVLPQRRDWGEPFLGWQPCHESFDSMRPLWVVPHIDGCAFVTQAGAVFESLTSGRGG